MRKYISVGVKEIREELISPIKNSYYGHKPNGGLWASPYWANKTLCCPWLQFLSKCPDKKFVEKKLSLDAIVFNLKKNVKILEIVEIKDIYYLLGKYFKEKGIDYEKLFIEYDCIFITEEVVEKAKKFNDKWINSFGEEWMLETLLVGNIECIEGSGT